MFGGRSHFGVILQEMCENGMSAEENGNECDVLVLGAGISGLATAKCLRDVGFNVVVLERTGDVGGLWRYKEKKYGVMNFTHINVSKHNYCFSDFPIPANQPDYLRHNELASYIDDYVKHFGIDKVIMFHQQINKVSKKGDLWFVETERVKEDSKGAITPTGEIQVFSAKFVAIATGHHSKPSLPHFPGLDKFSGQAYHSIDYKDAHTNNILQKRVVVVGIGNSAVDVACNAASVGMCKPVYLSSRSGAWVIPNYVFGSPTDHYACRLLLKLPWQVLSFIMEMIITLVTGHPRKWHLNPTMHALSTQPTVSPTLIHHIQRGEIKVVPNIQRIEGNKVTFTDGTSTEADHLILCTGYTIDLPFLSKDIKQAMLKEETNSISLYKNVFAPSLDHTLAFIGFVQPASGGILSVSEVQARWWAELCSGNISLPSKSEMEVEIEKDMASVRRRWTSSNRHTIQTDPLLYNDEISSFFGARPEITKHPWLALRLLIGTCGPAQWRLQGPGRWAQAEKCVRDVPMTGFLFYSFLLMVVILLCLLYFLTSSLLTCLF